jgi:TorA maturation chaperone TorD
MEKTINRMDAQQRSAIYGLLAEVFTSEVSNDLLLQIKESRFLETLSDADSSEMDEFFNEDTKTIIQELACEFSRLFIGPGKHISPHESVHHELNGGDWGKLWGKSTVEVQKFIKSTGMTFLDNFKGMPDHIAVEFEFMKQLTLQEKQSLEAKETEKTKYYVSIQKKFLKKHIGCWVPGFCEKVIEKAELVFYRNLGILTKQFIEYELETLTHE